MKVKPAGGGGKGKGGAVADPIEDEPIEPEPKLDDDGNPIEDDAEPKLDDDGNPIEDKPEPKLDDDGNPIEEDDQKLDDDGNPIEDEPDPRDAEISDLKARLEAIEKSKDEPKKDEPKAMSDDDWKKMEEQWGVAEKDGVPGNFGRQGIQQIIRLMSGMNQSFREMLNSELGGFKKEAAIGALAREKGFEDIKGYQKGIEEFLKDFDPRLHSDKNLLKKAVIYARGMAATGKFKKALNSREQERKINAGGGHGKPGGKGGKPAVVLTAEQKAAAKAAKMPESEYIKYLTTDNLDDIELPE